MTDLTLGTARVSDAATSARWILGDADLPAHVDPRATALRWGDTSRTYAELRARVEALFTAVVAMPVPMGSLPGCTEA